MSENVKSWVIILLLTASLQTWVQAGTAPIGSEFTYQGELLDNGSPANGQYDLYIELHRYIVGSNASPLDFTFIHDVEVSNGLFNVQLDFGDLHFNGHEAYLQLQVRAGNSTGEYEVLSPRQRINATPYAIQAEFVENESTQWELVTNGIYYDRSVMVGRNRPTNSVLTTNSEANQSPFTATINGGPVFLIGANRGTQIGDVNIGAPNNGLSVEGDVTQQLASHGFVKAATEIECGSGLNGDSIRYFNNVNSNDFTTTQNGAAGGCIITVPFGISNAFFTVSAYDTGGVSVFETVVASCSAVSGTEIQCQLQKIGANTSVNNGVVQLTIF